MKARITIITRRIDALLEEQQITLQARAYFTNNLVIKIVSIKPIDNKEAKYCGHECESMERLQIHPNV